MAKPTEDVVDLYQRMKVAEHAAEKMATDLAVGIRTIKLQRRRIEGLEFTVGAASRQIDNGDYTGALATLKGAMA